MRQASNLATHKDFWETHETVSPTGWDSPGTSYDGDYACHTLYDEFPYIMQWDDSGAVEALSLAGKRRDAMAQGLPWTSLLPEPGLYLEKITWDVRESLDLPDSADSLAAKEDKRQRSRSRGGGRNSGRWGNHDIRDQEYRSHEVAHHQELPTQDVWSSDKNVPLSFGDPFLVPTGWGDMAVDQAFPPGDLTRARGGWTDAIHSRQAAPSPNMHSQAAPSGWGSCEHAGDHVVSLGWGNQTPVRLLSSPYERQRQVWTPQWPNGQAQILQQQQQQQQQAHSQLVDVRWQPDRYTGQQPVQPRQMQAPPGCGNISATLVQESLPGTLQQRNFQNRSEVAGDRNYGNGPRHGWDGGGAGENQNTGERTGRDRSGYRAAPPPTQDVWKQRWQPVANHGGHGTRIYY